MQLRSFTPEDLEKLISTFCGPWSTLEKERQKWKTYLEEQQIGIRSIYLFEERGELAGYGSLLRHSHHPFFQEHNIPEINDLWIGKSYRKRGLATQLIGRLEALAWQEGYREIGLGVGLYQDYGAAQRLYVNLGYKPTGTGITYNGTCVIPGQTYKVDDELLLWLTKKMS